MFRSPTEPVRANALALSRPGTCRTIALPGLKPSLRLYSAVPIRCPLELTGIAFAGRRTRRPVALDRSRLVNRLFGNGSRHGVPEYGWQSAAGFPAAGFAPGAAPALEISAAISAATISRPAPAPFTIRFATEIPFTPFNSRSEAYNTTSSPNGAASAQASTGAGERVPSVAPALATTTIAIPARSGA